jgi:hypothetical protein
MVPLDAGGSIGAGGSISRARISLILQVTLPKLTD